MTWPSDRGPVQTGLDLSLILQEFRPRFAAMTGICAGDRKKVKLGDLIIAECAYLYEEGKVISGPDGEKIHLIETRTVASTSQVIQYTKGFDGWKEPLRAMKQAKLKREPKPNEKPRRFIVPMASGMAVRGDNPFPWLRERFHRNTIALDMEAATFYRALGAAPHIHALVVKGVSDYGDGSKNDAYREYAARASAVYLFSFIQEYVTDQTMPRHDGHSSRAGPEGIWNVPYIRNPHFTGRDELLDQLEQHFTQEEPNKLASTRRVVLTQSQVVKGLGGIGKTQIVVEYAYRSRDLDRYMHTFWVNSASEEMIITSFVTIAELLPSFAAKDETDQRKLVEAVKRWLEECEQRWLIIFDNADDLSIIQQHLPQRGKGDILLTTRAHAAGSLAISLEVETMGFLEGTQLLLRRAQRFEHASDEEINQAGNIVIELDHFPLALDQAGAYIEETQCSFGEYLQMYRTHRKKLLVERGLQTTNYPNSVATTWSLSFQKVEQANPAAAELLRLCAFLAPDMIPEELIREGAAYWTPSLQQVSNDPFTFNQMIIELLKFSLIKRLTEGQALSIHRLVQAVQMDMLKPEMQRQWAERVIRAVNHVFPDRPKDIATWPQCLRYLDQVQACNALIKQYSLPLIEAAQLLNRAGFYLSKHALYTIAEPLYQCALTISTQAYGEDHLSVAIDLDNLGVLYKQQGKYEKAEPLLKRALQIREQQLGPDHPDTAITLDNLGGLYQSLGRYEQSESLSERAVLIFLQQLQSDDSDTMTYINYLATSLNNLANLYEAQGRYEQSELLYQHAIRINEKVYGLDHLEVAIDLNNLASLYYRQEKYEQAEPLLKHVLSIHEQQWGPEHPHTAISLNNLALLYESQEKYEQAEPLLRRALAIDEKGDGLDHLEVAINFNNLALLYLKQRKYEQVEPLLKRALQIKEQQLGPVHPSTATGLTSLARLYYDQGKYEQVEPLLKRALQIREQQLGPDHLDTAASLTDLANLYEKLEKCEQAEQLYRRALAIRERQLGADHPNTAMSLNNLAILYRQQGNYIEAEPLFQRALAIREQQLGAEHPDTARSLHGLAILYRQQEKYEQAELLLQRALAIREKCLGAEHLDTADALHELAELYQQQEKHEQADTLYQHGLSIREQRLGPTHPETQDIKKDYATFLQMMGRDGEAKKLEEGL